MSLMVLFYMSIYILMKWYNWMEEMTPTWCCSYTIILYAGSMLLLDWYCPHSCIFCQPCSSLHSRWPVFVFHFISISFSFPSHALYFWESILYLCVKAWIWSIESLCCFMCIPLILRKPKRILVLWSNTTLILCKCWCYLL